MYYYQSMKIPYSVDYRFWGTLKVNLFYNNALKELIYLKNLIRKVITEIKIDEITTAISRLNRRIQLLENAYGDHFKYLL